MSRVFHLHLTQLLKDIKDNHILGTPVATVHVIEFQKRGLPHCHLLIILKDEDKLRDRHDIDELICAELPDEATYGNGPTALRSNRKEEENECKT